ncbi:MAG: hypothetical protein OEO77_10095, partial [Acidimicrobiia bacterium]|nr:hypothetical protein [Acidimicrobiia bacterium]
PARHGPVIGVGDIGDVLERICPTVEQVATITNRSGVANQEAGLPVYLCLDPERQLADIWDEVRHYN